MKLQSSLLPVFFWASHFFPAAASRSHGWPPYGKNYPTRDLAGVSVINTRIVRDADEYARQHGSAGTYKHVIRSWVYGAAVIEQNKTLKAVVDLEVHAVAAILHDLGWDPTPGSPLVSSEKRFEIDGAIAARNFIRSHPDGKKWEERRVQLVWDAIALHATPFAAYKETDVVAATSGIGIDLWGPSRGVTKEQFDHIATVIPRFDVATNRNETLTWLCRTKPRTTYDTFQQAWGEAYVEGYAEALKGNRYFDRQPYGT